MNWSALQMHEKRLQPVAVLEDALAMRHELVLLPLTACCLSLARVRQRSEALLASLCRDTSGTTSQAVTPADERRSWRSQHASLWDVRK